MAEVSGNCKIAEKRIHKEKAGIYNVGKKLDMGP